MTLRLVPRLALACLLPLVSAVVVASPAGARSAGVYAPLTRPGPGLTVPAARLRAALTCSGSFTSSALEPVLLNPATGLTPEQNYSWNYERAFTAEHRPWCAVTMPFHTLGDIQTAAEYLVYSIRTMHAKAHRRIAVLGHSQGGMSMRWALRFWPDTRPLVDDVIGMAGSNHGTTTVAAICRAGVTSCPPADWQQNNHANFIKALNSGAETFRGVAYTEVFTHTDEVVQPNSTDATSSSALHTGSGAITNVSTQDICPLDVYEHLAIGTIDPVAYALVQDALGHAGPALPARINPAVCTQAYQPGVDPLLAQTYLQTLAAAPGLLAVAIPNTNVDGAPEVKSEPALRCYTSAAGCVRAAPPTTTPSSTSLTPTARSTHRSSAAPAANAAGARPADTGVQTQRLLLWALLLLSIGTALLWAANAPRPEPAPAVARRARPRPVRRPRPGPRP